MPPSTSAHNLTVLTGTTSRSAAGLSMEVVDLIFEACVTCFPACRGKIAALSRPIRRHYRYPWSVEIYGSANLIPISAPSRGKVVVLRSQLERFLEDLSSFSSVFLDDMTFGEIENINIHLPFDDAIVSPLRAAAKGLKRLKHLSFSSWVDVVDLEGFMSDVGRAGSGLAGATSLALFFGAWDAIPPIPYRAWHHPSFFRNLTPYSNITTLKIRTALPMFPGPSGNPDDPEAKNCHNQKTHQGTAFERANLQERWSEKLRRKLPALTHVFLAESQANAFRTLPFKT